MSAGKLTIREVAELSLLPSQEMARTSLGGHVEHALAYAGTTFFAALASEVPVVCA